MAADIGEMLFVDILRMSSYPGQPFTGNIFQDLILFLIVPTIFIIMVLYIATGRIIPDKKIRVMLGVGAYLFIVASGYYSAFALLAGPYFIFLIFILGLLGFILGHFRAGGGGGGGGHYSGGGNYSGGGGLGAATSGTSANYNNLSKNDVRKMISDHEEKLKNVRKKIAHEEDRLDKVASKGAGVKIDSPVLANLRSDEVRLENELVDLRRRMGLAAGKF
jgi:hypothetical protein